MLTIAFSLKPVFKSDADNESLFVEINLYKKKYLIGSTYNPCKNSISKHLNSLGKDMDTIIPNYDNIILMGDFNCDPADLEVIEFCELFNLKNLKHELTCFKSLTKCIDLILTNRKRSFQNSCRVKTGLSNFHKMTLTVLKMFFKKLILYRDYKNYSNEGFRKELDFILQNYNLLNMINDDFNILFMKIFDKHAPLKKKYVRANEGPFITKELRKEITKRTKLLNIYRRDKSFRSRQAYRRQRNICTSLCKRNKKDYYSNLHPSCVTSNKKFWKSVKPLFSEKSLTRDNITLIEKGSNTDDSKEVADTFSDFFNNTVKNLCIERERNFSNYENLDTITDPISKAINRFELHPSVQETIKIKDLFVFTHITPRDVV